MMKIYLTIACLALYTFYSEVHGVWTQKAPFPGNPRETATDFSIGGKVYLVGGGSIGSQSYKDFWERDALTNIWTRKADLPLVMISATGFTIANKVYW